MQDDKKQKIFAIRLDAPGVLAVGKYQAGKVYTVGVDGLTLDEARRLVSAKGFTELSEAAASKLEG